MVKEGLRPVQMLEGLGRLWDMIFSEYAPDII